MSEAPVVRKTFAQAQSTASGHTQMTSRQPFITEPTASKRVCFYKSGDAQFSGLPVVINSRTFKTFEALLDSLSKRVPLPFGVRTITTPRGHTAVRSLDQLHHGHSYICSDRRTVKPIDLERAQRKLPPWYHARPISPRGLAWFKHNTAQHGAYSGRRNEHAILLHTPKWLVLFRNGEPEVKHRLMLQRRTTYSFEALLDHISEVMHFLVLKLYTPEGRRVDGLPALILSSGVLVAAGRERFKKINYDVQKSSPPTWLPPKRLGRRRLITRKKKASSTKSYPFSSSSEHYILNQIQNSMPGSVCDFPSNLNGSVEAMPGQHLESVAETDIITSLDGEREDEAHMPSDDDIEKSFRVNQDGSMTVEMKVRLTIKEEETIHWTTTVSRSNVQNQLKAACPDLDGKLPSCLLSQSDNVAIENNGNSHFCPDEGCRVNEQNEINNGPNMESEKQPSPPAHFPRLHNKQGCIEAVSDSEIHSYMEDLDNGEVKQEECMVQHPVPKPRCTLPSEMNTSIRLQSSHYRSSEILQYQDNENKMCETVLHIYENQTCQENFSGNTPLGLQGIGSSPYGSPHGSIASSDTIFPASSDNTFHPYNEDIKTATVATIKCQSNGRKDILSTVSKPYTSTFKTSFTSTQRAKVLVTPVTASSKASVSRRALTTSTTTKRKPVRVIVKKNHLFKFSNSERKQRDNKADILKEIKKIRADILSQKGATKLKEHSRTKTVQRLLKRRNNGGNGIVENKKSDFQVQTDSYTLPKHNLLNGSLSKSTMTQQTSEYVELWLQKSEPQLDPVHSSLETIPKNNTMVKASLFNQKSVKTIQQSTKKTFDEKEIHGHSSKMKQQFLDKEQMNSDNSTKIKRNHQPSKLRKTYPFDSENTKPSENTEPSKELIDLQAQKFYTVKMSVRPDMKPVLDQLCYCIQSLREIIQHKQSLYMKTSKCVPDFFSHLASIFSSSSTVFFAFLSVMALKDGLSHLNACCHSETNLSCSEAMLMLQSLKEVAVIEDTEHLRVSLTDLRNSASDQLLQNWKGFQILGNKARSSSETSDATGSDSHHRPSSEMEEHAIQLLMEHLGVPERVREELATLHHVDEDMTYNQKEDTDKSNDSFSEIKIIGISGSKEKIVSCSEFVLEDYVNIYVNSVIDKALNAHLKDIDKGPQVFMAGSLAMKNLANTDRCQKDLRSANFYNIMKTFQGDAITDSDICEDMPSSESSFGVEMYRELVLKGVEEQGLENVRDKGQEEERTDNSHHEEEEKMRAESERDIDEGRGTLEDNFYEVEDSKSLKTAKKEEVIGEVVNDTEKDREEVEEKGTHLSESLNFSVEENISQQEENGSYSGEIFPEESTFNKEEALIVKMPQPYEIEETSDIEVDEMQYSITHKDFCMESRTSPDDEHVIFEEPECYTIYQENFVEIPEEAIDYEENEILSKDERESPSLQDQNNSVNRTYNNTAQMFDKNPANHTNVSNVEEKIAKTTENREWTSGSSIDSAPSSLAFSYDCKKSSALAKDFEANIQTNRVKSIREMFLAKSSTEIQHGQTQLSSPSSDLSDYESSDKKQSSTSSEILREEKGPCSLSIAKGYVRRTIEQLYGKTSRGSSSDEKRSPSTDKVKKREGLKGTNPPRLPCVHEAPTTVIPDLSYFNPTSSVEGFGEPTHCVTLNAEDAVLIDKGRWLLRKNQMSPKSCPENEDTPKDVKEKDVLTESERDSGKEDIPYSLFGNSPVMPDKNPSTKEGEFTGCSGKTFTYFHLPNASDSEVQADEQKTDTPRRKIENRVTPLTEPPKSCTDKHNFATVLSTSDVKKMDNKVHPILETTPPVVTQPTKKQGAEVARHNPEPDALEILYMFCGQHCPIL